MISPAPLSFAPSLQTFRTFPCCLFSKTEWKGYLMHANQQEASTWLSKCSCLLYIIWKEVIQLVVAKLWLTGYVTLPHQRTPLQAYEYYCWVDIVESKWRTILCSFFLHDSVKTDCPSWMYCTGHVSCFQFQLCLYYNLWLHPILRKVSQI